MLVEKVCSTIESRKMIESGDSVVCAVSGGADSVCLLLLLKDLQKRYAFELYCANLNHKIRGEEATRDSTFVKELCKKNGIRFFYKEADIPATAQRMHIGEEECGRAERYAFFDEISAKIPNVKIATAHNLGDNAETVLFHLTRGTSGNGLCGIPYVRGNIIRPLLDVSRAEIEQYLKAKNQEWVEDSTNFSTEYARNKIRKNVIPVLEQINPAAQRKIANAALLTTDDCEYLTSLAQKKAKDIISDKGLDCPTFSSLPIPLMRRIAYTMLEKSGTENITADKLEAFIKFCRGENSKIYNINGVSFFEKNCGYVSFKQKSEFGSFFYTISPGECINEKKWTVRAKIVDKRQKKRDNNIAVFDAERLTGSFNVRARRTGDKMNVLGMSGTKRLSDIFSNAKLPLSERDCVPIIEKNGEILFLCGLRQSGAYAPSADTRKFLIFEYFTKE